METFGITNEQIADARKQLLERMEEYAKEIGGDKAEIFHGTKKQDAIDLELYGFDNRLNYFEMSEPDAETAYGPYVVVVDPYPLIDRLYVDPEGFVAFGNGKEFEHLLNKCCSLAGRGTLDSWIKAGIDPGITLWLWSLAETTMSWVVVKGKIEPKHILRVHPTRTWNGKLQQFESMRHLTNFSNFEHPSGFEPL